jgi:hypothetical protein
MKKTIVSKKLLPQKVNKIVATEIEKIANGSKLTKADAGRATKK